MSLHVNGDANKNIKPQEGGTSRNEPTGLNEVSMRIIREQNLNQTPVSGVGSNNFSHETFIPRRPGAC